MDRIKELEEKILEIRAEIKELKNNNKGLLSKPAIGSSWYTISTDAYTGEFVKRIGPPVYPEGLSNNCFIEDYAGDYAIAFNTFFALRHCRGSESAKPDVIQYYHYITTSDIASEHILDVDLCSSIRLKIMNCRVVFDTYENALRAIETVGEDNIIHMMRTFAGVFE